MSDGLNDKDRGKGTDRQHDRYSKRKSNIVVWSVKEKL